MPPIVETPRPERKGERDFAEQLEKCLNPSTHLWYNYDPPQGQEIDVIMADPDLGIYSIEVKAVNLEDIEAFDTNRCVIRGRKSDHNPVKQALTGLFKLKQRLEDITGDEDMPWVTPLAAFPRISRHNFERRFLPEDNSNILLRDHINGIIFAEDTTNPEVLQERLRYIKDNPAVGLASNRDINGAQFSRFIHSLGLAGRPPEEPVAQFTMRIGRPQKESIRELLTPGSRGKVLINGLPGSGKTQALLDIAINQAHAGNRVLFTCFNKVLAAKLRTDLDRVDLDARTHNQIIIADIWQLRNTLKEDPVLAASFRGFFDTVCVDEAQDLQTRDGNQLDHIERFISPDAEWFFANGRDQELYGTKPQQVIDAESNPDKIHELRRPSHSHTNGFRESNLAQVAFDFRFDLGKIDRVGAELLSRMKSDPDFSDQTLLHFKKQFRISVAHPGSAIDKYKEVIQEELSLLDDLGAANDLMIITSKTGEYPNKEIRQAFSELGILVHDQVLIENRRRRLPENHIRFITVHSSRGLQATRVILLLPHLLSYGDETRTNSAAYIALSRAMNGTHMVTINNAEPSRFQKFVEGSIDAYKKAIINELL